MPLKKKQFRRGSITCQLKEEERLFLLSLVRLAKPKTDLDKRILQRVVRRFMGFPIHNFPLYPPKECPVCERTFKGEYFENHVLRCKQKSEVLKRLPPIDREVYERMEEML